MTVRPIDPDAVKRPEDLFPMDAVSASSMKSFASNPLLFKVRYLNRDIIDTATGVSAVIGKAFHFAMETYYGKGEDGAPREEAKAIEASLKAGVTFMEEYPEGWINYSSTVETRQAALERVAFGITEYVKWSKYNAEETLACEDDICAPIDVEWKGQRLVLPVPLKGRIDRVTRGADGKLRVRDYKTGAKFSDLDKIDGGRIIQAVEYYFLAYAKYGEPPVSMTYEEVKVTKNGGKNAGEPQVREYEIVYDDNPLYFEFYFRLYEDMIRAVNGEMVYVPNINALFDNEVAIYAYIQRLDVPDEAAKRMEEGKVKTLTELLKKDIQSAGNAKKLLAAVEDQLRESKSMDYSSMTNQDKITAKFLEHGLPLKFDSLVEGATVDLYRFHPSIGVKMSRIRQLADDVQQVLGALGTRVLAPIPGTTLVGFEVPREVRRFPSMPPSSGFDIAIGETVEGKVRRYDIRDAPHMLVAGASGSGKSVFAHAVIEQLQEAGAELWLIDPKQVEFSRYDGALTEREEISDAIGSLVTTMELRYKKLKAAGKRDAREANMRTIVLVIDEYADLAMADERVAGTGKTTVKESRKNGVKTTTREREAAPATIAENVQRIAQKGRAAGIHIILITQRASTKIVTGDIKVNFPVKVVFRMAKAVDSQVMLDEDGAEKLLGKGDMLFATDAGTERLQGYKTV